MSIKSTSLIFSLIFASTWLSAAQNKTNCEPTPPATCNPDDCCKTYCLGPSNEAVNPPVRPITCNGDWEFTIAGFYWNVTQDGMEYAVKTQQSIQGFKPELGFELINAEYKEPHPDWNFGFKLGLGYNTACNGWDFGVLWTRYNGSASSHDEAEADDNALLLPIWSNMNAPGTLFVTDIKTAWDVDLNLVDLELGREFWTSKELTLRPHIGLRIAYINQDLNIEQKAPILEETPFNRIELENDFKSIGARGGLNSVWNLGCGWAIFADTAFSILYGKFKIDHDESLREAVSPFSKSRILETSNSFRVSRFAADIFLGIQWAALFCDCQYALKAKFGWENHIFLNQNQLWRVVKGVGFDTGTPVVTNEFSQRRGDLSTQGWTLSLIFDF